MTSFPLYFFQANYHDSRVGKISIVAFWDYSVSRPSAKKNALLLSILDAICTQNSEELLRAVAKIVE